MTRSDWKAMALTIVGSALSILLSRVLALVGVMTGLAIFLLAHIGKIGTDKNSELKLFDFAGKEIRLNKYPKPWLVKAVFWAMVITLALGGVWKLGLGRSSRTEPTITELKGRFPGGFATFAVLTGGSATAGHTIIRSMTSYNIDIIWGDAKITELTPTHLTLQLQNIRITRTEMTPDGTRPAGTIQINGAAIWQIDRRQKLVYINNGMAFWGYVLGGFLISDTNDELIVAIGLQQI
jgi:uncharacterized membrane protein (Fun14 family)